MTSVLRRLAVTLGAAAAATALAGFGRRRAIPFISRCLRLGHHRRGDESGVARSAFSRQPLDCDAQRRRGDVESFSSGGGSPAARLDVGCHCGHGVPGELTFVTSTM